MLIVALLLAGAGWPWMIIGLSLVVGITDALSMPSFSSIIASIVEREWCKPLHRDNCAVRRLASTCLRCVVAAHGGSLATGISVSLLGIREALLINGMLAILVQVLIGRHSGHTPVPGNPDAPSPVRSPRHAA